MITPKESKAAGLILTRKLASYFKIKANVLFQDVKYMADLDEPGKHWYSPMLDNEVGFNHPITCCQVKKLNLAELLDWEKFQQTALYQEFIFGEGGLRPEIARNYLLALQLKGTVWAVYRSRMGYEGGGGIFVGSKGIGFVLEPLGNFLRQHYPHPE